MWKELCNWSDPVLNYEGGDRKTNGLLLYQTCKHIHLRFQSFLISFQQFRYFMWQRIFSDDCVSSGPQTFGNAMINSQLNGVLLEARDFGKTLMGFHILGGPYFCRHIDGVQSE